jgi:hypothetical protein
MNLRSIAVPGAVVALLAVPGVLGSSAAAAEGDSWWKDVKISGYGEVGGLGNPAESNDPNHLNWGHLFTDKDNTVELNQISFIVERPIDAKKQYDLGFRFQGMYGSDVRYTHFMGELDHVTDDRFQWDIVEANLLLHTPWLGAGGTDLKVGQYVTLEGAEVIDPRGDFFYSHSYIFNFGIPFKHTGMLATTHVNPMLDLYYGIDTGVNTTFGFPGDPNDQAAFHGGIGLTLWNGDLTILATTHIGEELPTEGPGAVANVKNRYLNDITAIWKVNKNLTATYDFNYIRDDTPHFGTSGTSIAEGFGIASYWVYSINDNLSVGLRNEWWRDEQGAFVGAFPGNEDFVNSEEGFPCTCIASTPTGRGTSYYAITAGLNIKPTVPKDFDGLVLRPEVRWDHSTDTKPFDGGTRNDQVTVGADVVVPFVLSH